MSSNLCKLADVKIGSLFKHTSSDAVFMRCYAPYIEIDSRENPCVQMTMVTNEESSDNYIGYLEVFRSDAEVEVVANTISK